MFSVMVALSLDVYRDKKASGLLHRLCVCQLATECLHASAGLWMQLKRIVVDSLAFLQSSYYNFFFVKRVKGND